MFGKDPLRYDKKEEILNSLTHGIGAGLAIAALVILVVFSAPQGDIWRIVSFAIFGSTMITLYLSSTFYHAFIKPKVKTVFKFFDHASIYLLIAGTYTPFLLVNMRGPWGWSLFGVIWGLAFSGIIFKAFFIHRFNKAATVIYILMGWMIVIAMRKMFQAIELGGIIWLVAGGLSYTVGTIFYLKKNIRFFHTIWHLFVLGGSICHFFAILLYVLPE
ncbi:MAG: hemolysin III family protein [Candidatus Marinimicrobia bacterium]|nr:hemolysin III family protein [Candidatus Neomarinimicrobiota bacterium]